MRRRYQVLHHPWPMENPSVTVATRFKRAAAGDQMRATRSHERNTGGLGPRVVVAGRPGAGKGTQGARLARCLDVQYLSTGDLLRHEIAIESPLGSAVERLVAAGRLVPTGLIVAIVETNLVDGGYVLDGFPRTVEQAEALFNRQALAPTLAIEIVVPAHIALARLTGRGRRDDDSTVASERLVIYETDTVPALDLLDRRGLLVRVDGNDSPDAVEQGVLRALVRACPPRDGSSLSSARVVPFSRDNSARLVADREYAGE